MKQDPAIPRVSDLGTNGLILKHLGIDTYRDFIVYLNRASPVCRSEGFEAQARVEVRLGSRHIVATLHTVAESLLGVNEAGLSEAAWRELDGREGESVTIRHAEVLESLSALRAKVYGRTLTAVQWCDIVKDVAAGHYSDLQLAALVTACAGDGINLAETVALTRAMVDVGDRLEWDSTPVVDKHCVGGLPGNRTTLIVVPIVAAAGLTIPKTSSRAITSPAGTADTMEMLAPVALSLQQIRRVVERQHGCIVWGDNARLSPADDVLIRVERPLDFDSDGQMAASILSKKIAAGATHVLIDMPIGPTAKVRSQESGQYLAERLKAVGTALGLSVSVDFSDGTQPVGRGIGPALEAHDVLAVLRREASAPPDLRARSLHIAGRILEFSKATPAGSGTRLAAEILDSGRAWQRFQSICEEQGGLRVPPKAALTSIVTTPKAGVCLAIDNRRIAQVAKLAGAPRVPAAGIYLHVRLGDIVERNQPLFTIHADAPGELAYALQYLELSHPVITVGEPA